MTWMGIIPIFIKVENFLYRKKLDSVWLCGYGSMVDGGRGLCALAPRILLSPLH